MLDLGAQGAPVHPRPKDRQRGRDYRQGFDRLGLQAGPVVSGGDRRRRASAPRRRRRRVRAAVDDAPPPRDAAPRRRARPPHQHRAGGRRTRSRISRRSSGTWPSSMRVPTIVAGAVMPDACPSGSAPGTIPVGGVVAAENAIHPGMHSADICCSMAMTIFAPSSRSGLLDAGMRSRHFGGAVVPRGEQIRRRRDLLSSASRTTPSCTSCIGAAVEHFATQGDGNHFFYVGRVKSSGRVGARHPSRLAQARRDALQGRHGGRREVFARQLSPETARHNAWIPAETSEGEDYWEALQTIRAWTKANHFAHPRHDRRALGSRRSRTASGTSTTSSSARATACSITPRARRRPSPTSRPRRDGLTLIPLNMAEPILIARGHERRERPRLLAARRRPQFQPHGL